MKMKLLILIIPAVICLSNTNSYQLWKHPFFEMKIPPSLERLERPMDIENPTERNCLRFYYDVRVIPITTEYPDGAVLSVEIYEDCEGRKLNHKDFIRQGNLIKEVISKREIRINNLNVIEREIISELPHQGIIRNHYSTEWYIQGNKRIYRFGFGSIHEKLYNKNRNAIKNSILSFNEKLEN